VRHGNFCDRLSWRMTYAISTRVGLLLDDGIASIAEETALAALAILFIFIFVIDLQQTQNACQ
jgi:hypothetical protein